MKDDEGLFLQSALEAADHLERARFHGYDPYDALGSPVFRLPLLKNSRVLRFGAQQVLKRLPLNLRPLLRVPKGCNPVTLGFVLQGSALLAHCDPQQAEQHRARADFCLRALERMRSPGYSGDCWGYDFDWESRHIRLPAHTPTVVATGFVTNALFTAYELLHDERAFILCQGATKFVLRDLNRTTAEDDSFCWSYSPLDRQAVLNASMKGARLCAQVFSVTRDSELAEQASRAVRFVVEAQDPSGRWPYSVSDARAWADNFHTGYVLDCLHEYRRRTNDSSANDALERGWAYYRSRFFAKGEIPKYYDRRTYPIDATACAQSIMTLVRFGDVSTASRAARWAIDHLQRDDGSFAYQVGRLLRNRISYIRWSTAPMFAALCLLADASRS